MSILFDLLQQGQISENGDELEKLQARVANLEERIEVTRKALETIYKLLALEDPPKPN